MFTEFLRSILHLALHKITHNRFQPRCGRQAGFAFAPPRSPEPDDTKARPMTLHAVEAGRKGNDFGGL